MKSASPSSCTTLLAGRVTTPPTVASNGATRAAAIARAAGTWALLATGLACGTDEDGGVSVDNSARAGDFIGAQPAAGDAFLEDDGAGSPPPGAAPASFTPAERGAWGLGSEVPDDAELGPVLPEEGRQDGCGTVLTGIVRDLPERHPDFGGDISGLERGLVQNELGADGNPVLSNDYADGFIQSPQSFAEWYETVPGENTAFYLSLSLEEGNGTFGFESHDFFPLDRQGFGNENEDHNFYFTFELHTRFRYAGGEVFRFAGDDDLWVFINGRLAIDLGGVHDEQDETIRLDAQAQRLGIEPGNDYALDFFQAERHVTESNFQIETTLEFTSCGSTVLR